MAFNQDKLQQFIKEKVREVAEQREVAADDVDAMVNDVESAYIDS